MLSATSFAAGALAWSAAEYCIHRFIGHGPRRRRPRSILAQLTPSGIAAAFNDEHLQHHADPLYFAPSSHKVLAAAVVIGASGAAASVVMGPVHGWSFALGLGLTYAGYEVIHRRIHTRAGVGRYGRWLRRHHLYHHHKTPRANHGVTSPLWDVVFGTLEALPAREPLRVPRKHAPRWALDGQGAIAQRFARDFVLAGAAKRGEAPQVNNT